MSDAAPSQPDRDPSPVPPRGPRTAEGRRRSRHNARVHGLTATLPDGDAEAALMQQFADRWAAQLGPANDAEEALIRSAAAAYARLERGRKAEEAALHTAAREAVERWEKRKRHAVRRKAQELARDPSNTVADLEASSFGCEWLMRHWTRLDARLAQGLGWDRHDLPMAMQLLGYQPQGAGPDGDPAALRLWQLGLRGAGLPVDRPIPGLPADPIPARAELRRLVAAEFDRLDALRNDLWERQDGPEAEAIAQAGLVDTTRDGQLRQRYRREAFSEMVRGINQAMRMQSDRRKEEDRRWHQAYPDLLRRRRPAGSGPALLEPPPGFQPMASPPLPAPTVADRPSAPPRPADHRNEPPAGTADAADDRPNPRKEHEMRCDAPADAVADDRRTEPRISAPSPRPVVPPGVLMTPVECRRRPSFADRRA